SRRTRTSASATCRTAPRASASRRWIPRAMCSRANGLPSPGFSVRNTKLIPNKRLVMAGLDPAIPLSKARPCHMTGIAGSSPAMTAGECTLETTHLRLRLRAPQIVHGDLCGFRRAELAAEHPRHLRHAQHGLCGDVALIGQDRCDHVDRARAPVQ